MTHKDKPNISIKELEAMDFREELSKEEMNHLKQGVLERIRSESGKKSRKPRRLPKAAVAAAACFLIGTTTVLAAGTISRYYKSQVEQDNYRLNFNVEKETPETSTGTSDAVNPALNPSPVRLAYQNLTGYTLEKHGSWYVFQHEDGFDSGKEFDCELIQVDQTIKKDFFVDNVSTWEDISINGNRAVYIEWNGIVGSQYSDDTSYSKRILVFYEDKGYILQFYAMDGLPKETLLQYASQITLEDCPEDQADSYVSLTEYLTFNQPEAETDFSLKINPGQVITQNDTISFDGMDYQVQKVEILDSISNIIEENGKGLNDAMNLWENRLDYSDEAGNLKSYTRETVSLGNGHTEPFQTVSSTKEVAQKFVLVELRIKNTTDTKKEYVMVCPILNHMKRAGTGYVFEDTNYNRPEAIQSCQLDSLPQFFYETEGGKGFYMKDLNPGQEEIYHIGYFVDEDMLDSMFLSIGNGVIDGILDGYVIDIRQ